MVSRIPPVSNKNPKKTENVMPVKSGVITAMIPNIEIMAPKTKLVLDA
jgi:hypothetical protein